MDRIYDGLHGSFGRCIFLIVNSIIRAVEQDGDSVEVEDFLMIFEMKYLHFNAKNPFLLLEKAEAPTKSPLLGEPDKSGAKKNKGRPRKNSEAKR